MNLYELTATEAISVLVDSVRENHPDLSKSAAKSLVLNALIANCIIEEIDNQVDFLIEHSGY